MQITTTTDINELRGYIQTKETKYLSLKDRVCQIIDNIIEKDKEELTLSQELNEKFLNLDFGSEFDIDATKIGISDAVFFVALLNQNNLIDYSVNNNKLSISLDDKKINATNSLLNMLQTSYTSNKAIRLDFDTNVTVILKLDKEGKIQAHFIPGNAEVENYLKNNIPILKQSFDNQEIAYSYLGYSRNKRQQKKSKKED